MTTAKPPKCLISYSHDSAAHRAHVRRLADSLRENGVDVSLDQYVEHDPPQSWPRWMHHRIDEADVVLAVVTKPYADRFWGRSDPSKGRGADWEGAIITGDLYNSIDDKVKYIPLVTTADDFDKVPAVLNQTTVHVVESVSREELVPLLRQIFGVPSTTPPPLGTPNFGETQANDAVSEAVTLLAVDETDALKKLDRLSGSANLETSARAAFALGEHYYASHQYSRSAAAFTRAIQCGPKTRAYKAAHQELLNVSAVMEQHFGDNSAGAFARKWLNAVNSRDFEFAWTNLDKDFRMVLAQDWILANQGHGSIRNYDRDDLAIELRKIDPSHELSSYFIESQFKKLVPIAEPFDESWGQAERPRRYGLDYEIVIFTPTDGDVLIWAPDTKIAGLMLVVRRQLGQWKLVNTSPSIPKPGWPPILEPIELDDTGFEHLPPATT